MKKTWSVAKKVLKWVGISVLVLVGVGLVVLAVIWRKPLGPPLELPTRTPTADVTATPELPSETETQQPTATEIIPTNTPTPEPACGGPESLLVLFIGTDARSSNSLYGLADVIRLIEVDFINARVRSLDIPRAINAQFPGVDPSNFGCQEAHSSGPLNQAYFYGTEGMGCTDLSGYGAGLLAHTLDANFNVQVDNYVAVDMVTFGYAIDAVGGVPIYVYETIDNRNRAGLPAIPLYGYFEAGSHWLSGEEAVRYARIRSIGGIFGRHDRQNEVLSQLYNRIMEPSVISKIPELIDAFYGRVMTDLSLDQVSQLACLGLMLEWDDIQFEGFTEDMFVEGYNEWGYTVLFAGPNVVSDRIAEFLQE